MNGVRGLTVGVKEIIDVAGLPTRNGSEACRDAAPVEFDASVVAALRQHGATIVGKTTTTEFAFTDPTDCRNPYHFGRSPGGSSSGSGAAVAAGMVDVALGTQTAGSLCRPAACCGAVGLKPTYGLRSTHGVTPLAPRFDTVGVIARSVDLADRAFRAMQTEKLASNVKTADRCITGTFLLDKTTDVNSETMAALQESAAATERISARTIACEIGLDFSRVVSDHRIVMNHEAFAAHGYLLADNSVGLLKPKFQAALWAGSAVTAAEAVDASGRLAEARSAFWASMSAVDAILTLPVPDGAPLIGATTGFQDWLTPWTVFGAPLVCLPWGLDRFGRPRSVMLASHLGQDAVLLGMAKALEEQSPDSPRPEFRSD